MVALPAVLKKALEKDTPQSKIVIAGLISMPVAITDHSVTDNSTGAGIGAGAALGITILMYNYLNPSLDHSHLLQSISETLNKHRLIQYKMMLISLIFWRLQKLLINKL